MTDKNYTSLHSHDYYSNPNMVECIDSPEDWMIRAKELEMKALSISNHGNVLGWHKRYEASKKHGIKYIHASEIYVTETLEETVRDNWHVLLLARNYEGFKELNKLTSIATRRDGHFYYVPRISLDELMDMSENIIMTSACLGGVLFQSHKNNRDDLISKFLQFMQERAKEGLAYLEVQPHINQDQIDYNVMLKEMSKEYDIPLVGTGDFHAISKESDETRMILKKSKKIAYENDDEFSLYMKPYDEFFMQFKKQGIWEDSEIEEFLENTNVIADQVEDIEIDTSIKYPKMYDTPEESEQRLMELIAKGIKNRGIDKLPAEKRKVYADRIKTELETIKELGATDYLLLEDMVKQYARKNNVKYGSARGSASGSVITYLTDITKIDPIKENLSFERFLNKERVGVADIDTDFSRDRRYIVQDYLTSHDKLDCARIIAFGTIQLKSAIKDIGRGLDMPTSLTDEISAGVEENESFYRQEYPELFKHVDRVVGCVVSMGTHPAGILVSDRNLDEEMGTYYVKDKQTKEMVRATAIDMKEVDAQQWVKLDILGLASISVLEQACELAGIDYDSVMPDHIDTNDKAVWDSIKEDSTLIFQFEDDFAHQIYKNLFSDSTIAKIHERNPDFSYTDLFSLANAILRPSGASYRNSVSEGEFYDNGHEALNDFLSDTLGRLVYQEQQTAFLVAFCGYTGGHADLVRRGIAKKVPEIMEVELPQIEEGFIKTMVSEHGLTKEKAKEIAEPFLQVFIDATDYAFSKNHSMPYSYLGYSLAWLRYYYPAEFITAGLNVNKDNEVRTTRLIEYALKKGIEIKDIKFRHSKAQYAIDKDGQNAIYQGIESIKYLNAQIADQLYELRDNQYNSFTDLLVDLKDYSGIIELLGKSDEEINEINKLKGEEYDKKTKVGRPPLKIDSRQIKILITLNFFEEFGQNKKLLNVFDFFDKNYKANHKIKTKKDRYDKVLQFEREQKDESVSMSHQCQSELEYLGHIVTKNESIKSNIYVVAELHKNRNDARLRAYQINTGKIIDMRIGNRVYRLVPFDEGDIVELVSADVKPKSKMIGGKWTKDPVEKDIWITQINMIKRGED